MLQLTFRSQWRLRREVFQRVSWFIALVFLQMYLVVCPEDVPSAQWIAVSLGLTVELFGNSSFDVIVLQGRIWLFNEILVKLGRLGSLNISAIERWIVVVEVWLAAYLSYLLAKGLVVELLKRHWDSGCYFVQFLVFANAWTRDVKIKVGALTVDVLTEQVHWIIALGSNCLVGV